ncbi:MAG: hypothetical protein H6644_14080 [Caldilineaceae bacterium]|nr:hypothetical protein [Caldilineaceae bacterium]
MPSTGDVHPGRIHLKGGEERAAGRQQYDDGGGQLHQGCDEEEAREIAPVQANGLVQHAAHVQRAQPGQVDGRGRHGGFDHSGFDSGHGGLSSINLLWMKRIVVPCT